MGGWDLGSEPRDQGYNKPRDRDQQGSGTKICHGFGIKDQKFGYKMGSGLKTYFVMTMKYMFTLPYFGQLKKRPFVYGVEKMAATLPKNTSRVGGRP